MCEHMVQITQWLFLRSRNQIFQFYFYGNNDYACAEGSDFLTIILILIYFLLCNISFAINQRSFIGCKSLYQGMICCALARLRVTGFFIVCAIVVCAAVFPASKMADGAGPRAGQSIENSLAGIDDL